MPKRRYFGTDGIRGTANTEPMTAEIAMKVGMAAGAYFMRGNHKHQVVIAKDTRLSSYMVENALTAGFLAVGMHVYLVGPMPTPAVAMLTRSMRADMGVMISASHNSFHDNGIKLFGPNGYKLSDEVEAEIEALMDGDVASARAQPGKLGRAKRIDDAMGRYIEYVKRTLPRDLRLEGLKIVIDCANGAAYKAAPLILWELGAEVISLGVEPNGFNINRDCGSTHTELLRREVVAHKADLGIALDGDADRLVMCDEQGSILDGDQLMAMIARRWQSTGELNGGGMVSTVMANLGLERFMESLGLKLHRTQVGDRYVMEQMQATGINIGGEPSGHIILGDHATTGDGTLAALQVLAVLAEDGGQLSEAGRVFEPVPQLLNNVRYESSGSTNPLEHKDVQAAIASAEKVLGESGRIITRKSGTEPLIRIMVEGEDAAQNEELADDIAGVIEAVSKGKAA